MTHKRPSQQIADLEILVDDFVAKAQTLLAGSGAATPIAGVSFPPVPSPATPPPLVSYSPTFVAPAGVFPGANDPAVVAVFVHAAASCKLFPNVLRGIAPWESGNFGKDPHAGPWIHGNNPGGIKFSADLAASLGALPDPYVAVDGSAKYMRWATWQLGILGLGLFLARPHYDAARAETTIEGQVHAVWAAEYSELDPDWLLNVTRIALALPAVSSTSSGVAPSTPSTSSPSPPSDGLSARIRSAALQIVGHPVGATPEERGANTTDPVFTYPPETEQGNLGCASAVSTGLILAGVLPQSKFQMSVAGLSGVLVAMGWRARTQPGPETPIWIPVWKPASGGTHQHIGICFPEGSTIWAIENSSARRHVEKVDLATFGRELAYALIPPVGA